MPRLALTIAPLLILIPALATAEPTSISVPLPDALRGRALFVTKACVVCHAVGGVGGGAGPAMDAAEPKPVDPVDFSARMWRGALAMIVLQSEELGYQIEMTGQEIADLAAFAASPTAQAGFSEAEIPEVLRGWAVEPLDGTKPGEGLQ